MRSFILELKDRELGLKKWNVTPLSRTTERSIDQEYHGILTFIESLRQAVSTSNWHAVEGCVGDIIMNLLDNSSSNLFAITPDRRRQREFFVSRGGIQLLLKLFQPPFISVCDARLIPAREVRRKSEVWNEILVILREVSFAIPTLSEQVFSREHIIFFFTMLQLQPVFDNTMNLLEEILACRDETFDLCSVPDFYTLVGSFSARQLAHFCRVLSLVLFEPEDRHIMEGAQVLYSTELLLLRRNRMAKNSGVVEKKSELGKKFYSLCHDGTQSIFSKLLFFNAEQCVFPSRSLALKLLAIISIPPSSLIDTCTR